MDTNRADDPRNMGQHIAQQIPGVDPVLFMLRQAGEQMPGMMQKVMQLLGMGGQQGSPFQGGQKYGIGDQLPRSPGVGPDGRPIIIPGSR